MKETQIKMSSNRSFGIVFFIFFLIISIWPLMNGENIRFWAFALSIIFLILGIINSIFLTPLNKLWFKLGLFLGKIVSPIVMGAIFFLVVTPTGIIMRLIGRDLLKLKKNNLNTYWLEKKNENSSMKNQF